ncbi:MAG: FKBP-type peptidyl-prolyl cis-trans isomerase [Bacteroidia bacterium]|nr:FKBP-type peptidyl-prolyl cis-trans isomerase [Bacteroidia bacterium]
MKIRFVLTILLCCLVSACKQKSTTERVVGGMAAAPKNSPSIQTGFQPYPIDSTQLKTTSSGLKIYIKEEGTGNTPKKGEKVIVNYHGQLLDGTKFDSSFERGMPFEFVLGQGQVIRGWDEGIAQLKVGSKAVLIVPPDLGYGSQSMQNIPPNSTLVFYIELLGTM